jgi:hypothetical protein
VAEESLFFEPPQYRSDCGVFHRVPLQQGFPALLRGGRSATPDLIHHKLFQLA